MAINYHTIPVITKLCRITYPTLTRLEVHLVQAVVRIASVHNPVLLVDAHPERAPTLALLVQALARLPKLNDWRHMVPRQLDNIPPVHGRVQVPVVLLKALRAQQVPLVPDLHVVQLVVQRELALERLGRRYPVKYEFKSAFS